jgi:hypothetical protein
VSSNNLYKRKHHPCPDFSNLIHLNECAYIQLATDIASGTLPARSFAVPNMCDDMHDCTTSIGDTWLSSNLPAMISAVGPRGLVILTWDEDNRKSGNQILTVFAGPMVKSNYVSSQTITLDCSGRRVRSLFADRRSETSTVTWDGSRDDGLRAAAGLYFLYVSAGRDQAVRRLALTR